MEGVELCGTLKNVVAIAAGLFLLLSVYFQYNLDIYKQVRGFDGFGSFCAGFVDGLDMGNNTKVKYRNL